jgi:putative membrane protein
MQKLTITSVLAFAFTIAGGCGSGTPSGSTPNGLGEKEAAGASGGTTSASNGGSGTTTGSGGASGAGNVGGGLPDVAPGPVLIDDQQVLAVKRTANQGEVDQANAALGCAQSPDVIGFAKEMIADHTAALAQIDALIAKLGSKDSPENAALMNVGQQQLKLIKTDSSGACDQTYIKTQVMAHGSVLALINEVLLPSAQAPEVKAEVSAEKPVVQMHLDNAIKIAIALGIDLTEVEGMTKRCDGAPLTEGQVVQWLIVSNQGEVSDGQKVLDKAVIPEARAFAQRMITDHGAALARVQALAKRLGITPEPSQESKEKKVAGMVADEILDMLTPPMFDLTYVDLGLLDHIGDLDAIDDKLLPSTCTPDLKAEVQAERLTVATHEAIVHAVEPTVRAEANPQK